MPCRVLSTLSGSSHSVFTWTLSSPFLAEAPRLRDAGQLVLGTQLVSGRAGTVNSGLSNSKMPPPRAVEQCQEGPWRGRAIVELGTSQDARQQGELGAGGLQQDPNPTLNFSFVTCCSLCWAAASAI